MRCAWLALALACALNPLLAQDNGPSNEKARKTYEQALENLNQHMILAAFEGFKKADKQDGGRCFDCQRRMIKYGIQMQDWKTAETAAQEMVEEAQGNPDIAMAHYQVGLVLASEGMNKRKDEFFSRAHREFTEALKVYPDIPEAVFADGRALAHLEQDDAAKAQFARFVQMVPPDHALRRRALRYVSQPELARARMAPPFSVTTIDGRHVALDDFSGKVVLIDFWATWCGPCREALPHMQKIAKKFQGEPLVILSVSLDADEKQWKAFVTKNEMTWLNYRDGGFNGPIATMFGVRAIPHTFTIDADGVLQDERIGDASIEGKMKKLLARARELQVPESTGH